MDTAIQVYGENAALPGQSVVKICRLCCSDNQADLSLLFPEGTTFKSNKLLLKKIFECTTVQVRATTVWQKAIENIDPIPSGCTGKQKNQLHSLLSYLFTTATRADRQQGGRSERYDMPGLYCENR